MNKINRLDLKQLRILQALLRERNASRVAGQVGLTQQAVSDQLRKLRDVFDDPLFVRNSSGMTATSLAENLQPKVDQILKGIDDLLQPDEFEPELVNGNFVIAATDYVQQVVLPKFLYETRKQAPKLKIEVRDIQTETTLEMMATGQIDMSVGFPEYFPDSYPKISLFKETYVCIAAKKLGLSKKNLTLNEIAALPQIAVTPAYPLSAWFKGAEIEPNFIVSAPCFSAVPKYLEATVSIAFLPSRIPLCEGVERVMLDGCPVEFEIAAAWHLRSDNDPLLNWIKHLLLESCKECTEFPFSDSTLM